MKAGGVTFLLSLALIHVSWAGNSTHEIEEVPAEDGVVYKAGYVFNEDKVFAKGADALLKCSAEFMKDGTTKESRYYMYCQKMGVEKFCFHVSLDNVTYLPEELGKLAAFKRHSAFKDGYEFEKNRTLYRNVSALFSYAIKVLRRCNSRGCRYYSYCKKVGDNVVCLTVALIKPFDLLNEEKLLNLREDPTFFKFGYIFDNDDVFAEKSGSLLNYTREIMRSCTTEDCRDYLICSRVNEDITCLHVWFVKGVNEFIAEFYPDLYREPKDVNQRDYVDFHYREQEDNYELLDGEDNIDLLEGEDNNELLEGENNNELFEGEFNNDLLEGEDNIDEFRTPSRENMEEEEDEQN